MCTGTIIWGVGDDPGILGVSLVSSGHGWVAVPMIKEGNVFSTTIDIPGSGVDFKIQLVRQGSTEWVLHPGYPTRFDGSGNENNYITPPPLKNISARSIFRTMGIREPPAPRVAPRFAHLAILCFLAICFFFLTVLVRPRPLTQQPHNQGSRLMDTRAFRASLPRTLQSLAVVRGRPTQLDLFYLEIINYIGAVADLPADCPESAIASSISQGRWILENNGLTETISYSQGLTLEEREYRFELHKSLYDTLSKLQASLQASLPVQQVPKKPTFWSSDRFPPFSSFGSRSMLTVLSAIRNLWAGAAAATL